MTYSIALKKKLKKKEMVHTEKVHIQPAVNARASVRGYVRRKQARVDKRA